VFCHMGCHQGTPDCRVSGFIANHKQMVQRNAPYGVALAFGNTPTAWYVNSSLIRTKLGKCSFAWDGGTQGKVNMGCGAHQGRSGNQSFCDEPDSPYKNKCCAPDCKETTTGDSPNVKNSVCSNMDQSKWPTTWQHGPDCFWKGPAYYPPGGFVPDETHAMLKWRVDHQSEAGPDPEHDPMSFWNEMVLDGDQVLKQLEQDAAATIPAFVYNPKLDPQAKVMAQKMANALQTKYKMSKPVPVIKVDTSVDVRSGNAKPFIFESADEAISSSNPMVTLAAVVV